jgi:hypothetical protein
MYQKHSKKRWILLGVVLAFLIVGSAGSARSTSQAEGKTLTSSLAPLGTGFTYQGYLTDGGSPVSGSCDFQFGLWDSEDNATGQIGGLQTVTEVTVSGGVFTVILNGSGEFGSAAFAGDARWLGIAVRCPAGSSVYTALTPRQVLTATPYALYAESAGSAWSLTGNSGTTYGTNVLGTTDAVSLTLVVDGRSALRLEPGSGSGTNLLVGHAGNSAGSGVQGAIVFGGYDSNASSVTGNWGVVGGGADNIVTAAYGTVPGGRGARVTHPGQWAYSGATYGFGDAGVPNLGQTSLYVVHAKTKSANPQEMCLDSFMPTCSSRITIPDDTVYTFEILVAARSLDDLAAGYRAVGVIETTGGTTSFVGSPTVTTLGEDHAAWDVSLGTANNSLVVYVTGEADKNIRWVAKVQTVEVGFNW